MFISTAQGYRTSSLKWPPSSLEVRQSEKVVSTAYATIPRRAHELICHKTCSQRYSVPMQVEKHYEIHFPVIVPKLWHRFDRPAVARVDARPQHLYAKFRRPRSIDKHSKRERHLFERFIQTCDEFLWHLCSRSRPSIDQHFVTFTPDKCVSTREPWKIRGIWKRCVAYGDPNMSKLSH